MATNPVKVTADDNRGQTAFWENLGTGDNGKGVAVGAAANVVVQAIGTFSGTATISLQGSNDGGTTWTILPDMYTGAALTSGSAAEVLYVSHAPALIRPLVNAGDGSTDIDVYMHWTARD